MENEVYGEKRYFWHSEQKLFCAGILKISARFLVSYAKKSTTINVVQSFQSKFQTIPKKSCELITPIHHTILRNVPIFKIKQCSK